MVAGRLRADNRGNAYLRPSAILPAMPDYTISWHVEPRYADAVRRRSLAALARRVLSSEAVPAPAELSIVITSDATVRDLNRRFRGDDAATDVLSFGSEAEAKGRFVTPPGTRRHVGEVVISFPTAARQAKAAGHDAEAELAHLLVHGILHVLGYDHVRAAEARTMREREDALLGRAAH